MQQHMRGLEGISGLYTQMEGLVNDKTEAYNRLQEEHAKLLSEHTKVLDERDRLRTWGMDLQQGNLELQEFERKANEFERKYYEARHQLSQAQKENRDLRQNDRGAIEDLQNKLAQRDRQITNAVQSLDNNGTDYSGNAQDIQQCSLKINKGLDKWVGHLLEENLWHDKQLKILVQALESAGVRDWSERIHEIKTYVSGMEESRRAKEAEWKQFMDTGNLRISPVPGTANEDERDSGRSDNVQLLLNPEKGI
jgi:DNA repair exonuclease SbcCD ATPase subunit